MVGWRGRSIVVVAAVVVVVVVALRTRELVRGEDRVHRALEDVHEEEGDPRVESWDVAVVAVAANVHEEDLPCEIQADHHVVVVAAAVDPPEHWAVFRVHIHPMMEVLPRIDRVAEVAAALLRQARQRDAVAVVAVAVAVRPAPTMPTREQEGEDLPSWKDVLEEEARVLRHLRGVPIVWVLVKEDLLVQQRAIVPVRWMRHDPEDRHAAAATTTADYSTEDPPAT